MINLPVQRSESVPRFKDGQVLGSQLPHFPFLYLSLSFTSVAHQGISSSEPSIVHSLYIFPLCRKGNWQGFSLSFSESSVVHLVGMVFSKFSNSSTKVYLYLKILQRYDTFLKVKISFFRNFHITKHVSKSHTF